MITDVSIREKIDTILQKYSFARQDSLISILQELQQEIGYLNEDALIAVGKQLNIPSSRIYGLATFYNQFRFDSKGKFHIQVCHGTACHMLGAETLIEHIEKLLNIKVGQKTGNGQFSLEVVSCIGACAQAPVILINGEFYKELTRDSIKSLIEDLGKKED